MSKEQRAFLKTALANSSFVGLSHVASARSRWCKSFWMIVFLAGVVGFGFNFYAIAWRFFQFQVAHRFDPYSEFFAWPDITLCNPTNPIPFWIFADTEKKWKTLVAKSAAYTTALSERGVNERLENDIAMSSLDPGSFHFNYTIRNLILNAEKNPTRNVMTLPLTEIDFLFAKQYEHFYLGRSVPNTYTMPCLTFNPTGFGNLSYRVQLSREIERIQLFVVMPFDSYKIFDSSFGDPRLEIFISRPGHAISMRAVHQANAGSDIHLKLSMVKHKRLKNRGRCNEQSFQQEVFDVLFQRVRQEVGDFESCRSAVIQELTVERCGCYNPSLTLVKLENIRQPRLCFNMSFFSPSDFAANYLCSKSVLSQENTKLVVERRCRPYKQQPCDEDVYEVNHNALQWPEEVSATRRDFLLLFGSTLPLGVNTGAMRGAGFLRQNLAFLTLERKSEKVNVVQEEYSYPADQFVSDIGGIVGLWLGLSIISAFECLEFVFRACRLVC